MEQFCEYIETKIFELSEKEKNLAEAYRQDDAVFVKIEKTYMIFAKPFSAFLKIQNRKKAFMKNILKSSMNLKRPGQIRPKKQNSLVI